MARRRACIVAAAAILIARAGTTWAGGSWLYEIGAPDLGTANAGRAALASDASTAFGNPAGMARLEQSQLLFGLQPIIATNEFDIGSSTNVPGGGTNGGNAGGLVPSAGLYYVYSLRPDLKLGVSLNSYLGGALNYEDNWVGRYYTTQAELLTFNLNPVVSYRVLRWLSLGAGFSVQYARFKEEAAINNNLTAVTNYPDGQLKYDDWNIGFGGNAGVLVEIDPRTRFGVTYRSQVNQGFSDVPTVGQLQPGTHLILDRLTSQSLNIDITMPQEVMASVYRDLTDDLAVMANFAWQDWAQYGLVSVAIPSKSSRSLTIKQKLSGTYGGALGIHYRLAAPTILMLGVAYDSSPVTTPNRLPTFPVDRQVRFGGGVQYDVNQAYTLGFAYEFMSGGKAPIDTTRGELAGTLQGNYQANSAQFFNFTVIHRF